MAPRTYFPGSLGVSVKLEGQDILWMEPRKLQGLRPGAPRFSLQEQGAHTLQPGTHWRWLGENRWGRGGAAGVEGAQESGAAGGQMLGEHLWRREKPEGDRGQRQCLPVGENMEDTLVSGSGETRTSPLPLQFRRQACLPVERKLRSHLFFHLFDVQPFSSFSSEMIMGKST